MAIMSPNHKTNEGSHHGSPLLYLPGELRNSIYQLLIPDGIYVDAGKIRCKEPWLLALASTCHQLRAGSHGILSGTMTMHVNLTTCNSCLEDFDWLYNLTDIGQLA